MLRRAEAALNQRKLREAIKCLRVYVAKRPSDSKAAMLLARCLYERGGVAQLEESVEHLSSISDSDPKAAEARLRAGDVLLSNLGRPTAAEMQYRKAIELAPNDSVAARLRLFQIYWWEGRKTKEVMQWLNDVWRDGDLDERRIALERIFWLHYADFPAEQAYPLMQNFLQNDSEDYGARIGMARCFASIKQFTESSEILTRCASERPDDPIPPSWLAAQALVEGDWPTARQWLDKWSKASEGVDYWALRGEYLQQAEGRFSEAIECFNLALAERPDRWTTRYRLAQCLEAVGQRDLAKREQELSDRHARALINTRVEHLLLDIMPNLESRRQACAEIAELYNELGMNEESLRWQDLERELESRTGSSQPSPDTPLRPPE
jgi:tetratricopeptide (TPR) repeat protein